MKQDDIITIDQEILHGTPVFAQTRVPVQSLLDHLEAGETLDEFLAGFPSVNRMQAEAFLKIAFEKTLDWYRNARVA